MSTCGWSSRRRAAPTSGKTRCATGPRPYSSASWIRDLGEFVERVAAQPVVLLGHSLGTILALQAYAAWPDRVRAMMFVGGLPEVRPAIRERLTPRIDPITRDGL